MTQPLHVKSASTSFWLSSLDQQIFALRGFSTAGHSSEELAPFVEALYRLIALAAGFVETFPASDPSKEKERGFAQTFRHVVLQWATRPFGPANALNVNNAFEQLQKDFVDVPFL